MKIFLDTFMEEKNNSRTNIVWYVLCWNEMPILPFMIDYWKRIANKVIVYDNNSTDGSVDYLKQFDWIEVRPYPYATGDKLNDDINRRIKNECWKECKDDASVDWVIVSDLDEILWTRNADLDADLASLKEQGVAIAQPYGCDFMCEEFPVHDERLLHEKVRTYQHVKMWDKPILFDPHRVQEINYAAGAHSLQHPVYVGKQMTVGESMLLLLHFKYMSVEYLVQKRFAIQVRMSDINLRNRWGFEYLYNRQQIEKQFADKWVEAKGNDIGNILCEGK